MCLIVLNDFDVSIISYLTNTCFHQFNNYPWITCIIYLDYYNLSEAFYTVSSC